MMPRPFRVSDCSVDLLAWASNSQEQASILAATPRIVELMQAHLTAAIEEISYLPWKVANLGAILHTFKPPPIDLTAVSHLANQGPRAIS